MLLIHGGAFADWFVPLVTRVDGEGFRIIRVRLAGYGPNQSVTSISLPDHARRLAELLAVLNTSGHTGPATRRASNPDHQGSERPASTFAAQPRWFVTLLAGGQLGDTGTEMDLRE